MNIEASSIHASPMSQPDVPQVPAPPLDISHHATEDSEPRSRVNLPLHGTESALMRRRSRYYAVAAAAVSHGRRRRRRAGGGVPGGGGVTVRVMSGLSAPVTNLRYDLPISGSA